jgi:hypothetical protein
MASAFRLEPLHSGFRLLPDRYWNSLSVVRLQTLAPPAAAWA